MALDKSIFDVDDDGVEQQVPFNPNRYSNGEHSSMYILPFSYSSPSRTITHDQKHQKKKLRHNSCQTKPNSLYLISLLPDCQLNSIHHLWKIDMKSPTKSITTVVTLIFPLVLECILLR